MSLRRTVVSLVGAPQKKSELHAGHAELRQTSQQAGSRTQAIEFAYTLRASRQVLFDACGLRRRDLIVYIGRQQNLHPAMPFSVQEPNQFVTSFNLSDDTHQAKVPFSVLDGP